MTDLILACSRNDEEMIREILVCYERYEKNLRSILLSYENDEVKIKKLLMYNNEEIGKILIRRSDKIKQLLMFYEMKIVQIPADSEYNLNRVSWMLNYYNKKIEQVIEFYEKDRDNILKFYEDYEEKVREIMASCKNNEERVKRILLIHKIGLELKGDYNETALEWAYYNKNLNIVNLLREKGARDNGNNANNLIEKLHLYNEILDGNKGNVQNLIEKGVDVTIKGIESLKVGEESMMNLICMYGNLRQVKEIENVCKEEGKDFVKEVVESPGECGIFPIQYAIHYGKKDVVKFFLNRGVSKGLENVTSEDVGDSKILFLAVECGRIDIVKGILDRVNKFDEQNKNSQDDKLIDKLRKFVFNAKNEKGLNLLEISFGLLGKIVSYNSQFLFVDVAKMWGIIDMLVNNGLELSGVRENIKKDTLECACKLYIIATKTEISREKYCGKFNSSETLRRLVMLITNRFRLDRIDRNILNDTLDCAIAVGDIELENILRNAINPIIPRERTLGSVARFKVIEK